MADVLLPIIGADLANFSLFVDCRNNRLLEGVTSLSTSAQTASTRFPNIKTIGIGTPANKLAEFPDLTSPSGVPREVRHNTVHHIKTTHGPPVSCRPRRLAPDRLAIAKAEFDVMLREGAALGWSLVVSTAPHSQERQRLVPVWRLQSSKRTHYPGPLPRPAHSRVFSPVSGLHDIFYHRPRAGLSSDSGTPGRRAENGHHYTFWFIRISVHVLRPAQRRANIQKVHG